jgi:hypothetical protein
MHKLIFTIGVLGLLDVIHYNHIHGNGKFIHQRHQRIVQMTVTVGLPVAGQLVLDLE